MSLDWLFLVGSESLCHLLRPVPGSIGASEHWSSALRSLVVLFLTTTLLLRGMTQVLSPTSPSPLATFPQVIYLSLLHCLQLLNLDLHRFPQQSKASPLSSPTNIARRLPRTRSRTRISARASLESIVEESLGDGLDAHPARAMPQAAPDSTRDSGRTRVSRPLSWNGKNGIAMGRGMRDVCGIWYVGLFGPAVVRPQVC